MFTYRDFTGGTLGLAWVASASGELLSTIKKKSMIAGITWVSG